MLYSTAGSRLYIADAPTWPSGAFPASGWVEIGSAKSLGSLGVEYEMFNVTHMGQDGPEELLVKGVRRASAMPVILGLDPTDPGQVLLRAALLSNDAYPFRLILPDGTTTRRWWALVISMTEVFDAANAVMKLQAELKATSPITRSEA